jgi:hypothetical protein
MVRKFELVTLSTCIQDILQKVDKIALSSTSSLIVLSHHYDVMHINVLINRLEGHRFFYMN